LRVLDGILKQIRESNEEIIKKWNWDKDEENKDKKEESYFDNKGDTEKEKQIHVDIKKEELEDDVCKHLIPSNTSSCHNGTYEKIHKVLIYSQYTRTLGMLFNVAFQCVLYQISLRSTALCVATCIFAWTEAPV
jgi:SNF2 family DNA or RNA helicase